MRTCVYTYLIGSYDGLLEQPESAASAADFVCFTDDASISSETWTIVPVARRYAADPVRSARHLKLIGHEALAEYDVTLSIDASVRLKRSPDEIIEAWLPDDSAMAIPRHSYREQLLDEFDEVIRLGYDDPGRVYDQLVAYSLHHEDALHARPLWTGMMVRRRDPDVAATMRLWMDHVLRYSRRDQLSLPVALRDSAARLAVVDIDNFESEMHEWPVIESRRISMGKAATYASGPLLSEIRRAERRVAELERALTPHAIATAEEKARTIEHLELQITQGTSERAHLEERIRETLRDSGRWEQRWADTQGVLGAWTNLVRALKNALRRTRG